MILVILIFLEIIFKIFGVNNWKQFFGFIVNFFNVVIFVFYLLVWLSQLIIRLMKKDKNKSVFSWVDFFVMVEIGEKEGIFWSNEFWIIYNFLCLNIICIKDVMMLCIVVKVANQECIIQEFYDKNEKLQFFWIFVFVEFKDYINGFVLKDEILSNIIKNNGLVLFWDIMWEIFIINE